MTIPFTDHVVHHQKSRKRLHGTNVPLCNSTNYHLFSGPVTHILFRQTNKQARKTRGTVSVENNLKVA